MYVTDRGLQCCCTHVRMVISRSSNGSTRTVLPWMSRDQITMEELQCSSRRNDHSNNTRTTLEFFHCYIWSRDVHGTYTAPCEWSHWTILKWPFAQIVQWLQAHGAAMDVTRPNNNGYTPLYITCRMITSRLCNGSTRTKATVDLKLKKPRLLV